MPDRRAVRHAGRRALDAPQRRSVQTAILVGLSNRSFAAYPASTRKCCTGYNILSKPWLSMAINCAVCYILTRALKCVVPAPENPVATMETRVSRKAKRELVGAM